MTDRITLASMRFAGRHGVSDEERAVPQEIEVDLEVEADLRDAGISDDVGRTVDYGPLIRLCEHVVEDETFHLLEGIAQRIATQVLDVDRVEAVTVRVRKLAVPVDADIEYAQVEIRRERPAQ
jgi:7,8-dihydroneopterin aldolase/epimerase/oxygenase